MRTTRNQLLTGAVVSVLLAAPFIAILYMGFNIIGVPFLPYDLFDQVSRVLPGDVIRFGIARMVDVLLALDVSRLDTAAKNAERMMAAGMFLALIASSSLVYFMVLPRLEKDNEQQPLAVGLGMGLLLGTLMLMISQNINVSATAAPLVSALWIIITFLAWGAAHSYVFNRLIEPVETLPVIEPAPRMSSAPLPVVQPLSRRSFLIQLGGATATLTLIGAGLGELLATDQEIIVGGDVDISRVRDASKLLGIAPGTRPEYTPLENHYRIDINSGRPPQLDAATWQLKIDGLVKNPVSLSLDDLRNNYTSQNQFVTLTCISNRVGGDLIGTTQWTGVTMQDILDTVQPEDDAGYIRVTAADGFDEYVSINMIRNDDRIILAYAWDNVPLPQRHGFPLRIYIPDRYGMKQPKWITEMEFVKTWEEGYWVRRGWSEEAIVRSTSVVDTIAVNDVIEENGQKFVPVGGIAYAGARGISKVQVKVDDGEWLDAELRTPLSELTWVVWRYDWAFDEGEHTFAVRCVDGEGTPQIERDAAPAPDGATGIHSRNAEM